VNDVSNEPTTDDLYRRAQRRVFAGTAFLLLAFGGGIFYSVRRMRQNETQQGRVFAVAPFTASSMGDQYLGTGLADLLSARLAQLPNTRVVSTHALVANPQPSDAMGVNILIKSDLTRAGEELRLATRIVDSRSGRDMARPIEISAKSILELHRQNEARVLEYFPDQGSVAAFSGGDEAFAHFATGRGHLAHRTTRSLALAVQEFVRALSLDSGAAAARASLASALAQLALAGINSEVNVRLARANASIALAADPSLVDAIEAEALTGMVEDGRWERVMSSSAEAIRRSPGRDLAHLARAEAMLHAGLLDLALIESGMACVSNPRLLDRCEIIESTIQLFRGEAAAAVTRLKGRQSRATPHERVIYARALAAVGDSKAAAAALTANSAGSIEAQIVMSTFDSSGKVVPAIPANASHHVLYELGVLAAKGGRYSDTERLLIDSARKGFAPISWYENDPELATFRTRPEFANVRRAVVDEVRKYQRLSTTEVKTEN